MKRIWCPHVICLCGNEFIIFSEGQDTKIDCPCGATISVVWNDEEEQYEIVATIPDNYDSFNSRFGIPSFGEFIPLDICQINSEFYDVEYMELERDK